MRHLTILFCTIFSTLAFSQESLRNLLPSSPDQKITLSALKEELIGGLIHPLSGYPCMHQTDLIAKGAQDVQVTRCYIPSYIPVTFHENKDWDAYYRIEHFASHNRGWQYLPYGSIKVLHQKVIEVFVPDHNGAITNFILSGPNYSITTLASPPFGISNVIGDIPSGKHDVRNTRIIYEEQGAKITVYSPCGAVRIYRFKGEYNPLALVSSAKNEYYCKIEKEILPNGKVLRYHYNDKASLVRIESLDPNEMHVYASIAVEGSPKEGSVLFTSSTGSKTTYSYDLQMFETKFKDKKKKENRNVKTSLDTSILSHVKSPYYPRESTDYSHALLLSGYFGEKEAFQCDYGSFPGETTQHYKISHLSLPVGVNDTFMPLYEFQYEEPIPGKKEGNTVIKNEDGTKRIYFYSKDLLLTKLQHLTKEGKLHHEKRFVWDENNYLKSIEHLFENGDFLFQKSYEYDDFGNPTKETFTGDLTGNGSIESLVTQYQYSSDGMHLLLKEEHDDGKVITYQYLPNTNLLQAKLTSYQGKIFLREFFEYDNCLNLIKTTYDDGETEDANDLSGIQERRITEYQLRQQAPFLHMKKWVVEKYLDRGEEVLLKKTHLFYDQYGNVSKEDYYDSKGVLVYSIEKQWNERGDLLSETNPLNQRATYQYDERGRKVFSSNFSGNLQKTMYYDVRNRLRNQTENGIEGITQTSSYFYDHQDRLIIESDIHDNGSTYRYDPFCGKVTIANYPLAASSDGESLAVSTSSKYDAFGREIVKIDANGNETTFLYNAYGSPTEITYPDENKEFFSYTKKGLLESKTDREGNTTWFQYDILDRVISKTYLSKENVELAKETYTYSTFHLLEVKNKAGKVTAYSYDPVGRKISENTNGRITEYSYTSTGQLASVTKQNRENTLVIQHQYDLTGNLLEESKTDSTGNLLYKIGYAYDLDGKLNAITRSFNDKKGVETYTYDSFGRLVLHKDALGAITSTSYNDAYKNALNQNVLQTTTKRPNGSQVVVTYDAFGKVAKEEVFNTIGDILFAKEMFYDPAGNLVETLEHLYQGLTFYKTLITRYAYNSLNLKERITKGAETSEERETIFSYTSLGKLSSKLLPDDTALYYKYDPFGNLKSLTSSDQKIHYEYEYNQLGRLIKGKDLISGISLEREVDLFGNIIKEESSNHSVITKTYDAFDRPISVLLAGPNYSNQGKIFYAYDPLYLRSVTRKSAQSHSYCHRYNQYDLGGNLTSETRIDTLGAVIHTNDIIGRKISIISPVFTEKYLYDAESNLIKRSFGDTFIKSSYDDFHQVIEESKHVEFNNYAYASSYQRIAKNGVLENFNDLGELISLKDVKFTYDMNGNLILQESPTKTVEYFYDALGRLTSAKIQEGQKNRQIDFTYDPLDRLYAKTIQYLSSYGTKKNLDEVYLYDGNNEVGSFLSDGTVKTLQVLATPEKTPTLLALELGDKVYAPIIDAQNNLRRLVDVYYQSTVYTYDPKAFGDAWKIGGSNTIASFWNYKSKRIDSDLGLIFFGSRCYDSTLGRLINPNQASP